MSFFTRQFISARFAIAAVAASVAFAAQPSSAQELESFSIPLYAVYAAGGATVASAVNLPNAGEPTFMMNFALPLAYQNNGDVRIVVLFSSPSTCTARLVPAQLVRKRAGSAFASSLVGVSSGSPLLNLTGGVVTAKTFIIQPGGPLAGQKRGDVFNFEIKRQADDPSDTCASFVFVQGIDIRYAVPTP